MSAIIYLFEQSYSASSLFAVAIYIYIYIKKKTQVQSHGFSSNSRERVGMTSKVMVGAGELVTYNTRKDASAITIAFACV
jgi:hypothetical protein